MARAGRKRRNLDSTRGPNMISSPRKDSHPLTSMTGKNSVNSHMASSLAGGDAPSFTCTEAHKRYTRSTPPSFLYTNTTYWAFRLVGS